MPKSRLEIGHEAEDRAVQFLRELGYTIVTRNWKGRSGELDIVALDGEVFVFLEVKFRSDDRFPPEEGVTNKKSAHIANAIQEYLTKFELIGRETRFDTIAVQGVEIRHHQAVWEP